MHIYNDIKQINESLDLIIKDLSKSPNFSSFNRIYRNWSNIIDKKYLKYCYPLKVNLDFNKKTGKLIIETHNPATSFYINNNKDYILAKINTYFGYNSINSLSVKEVPIIIEDNYIIKQKKVLTKEQNDLIDKIKGNDNLSKSIKNLIYCHYTY